MQGSGPEPEPGPGEGPLPPSFEFVEGDKDGWRLMSAEMGVEVLSPSWFRFDYLSEGPSLRCEQFGSLENARSGAGSLEGVVVDYTGPVEGGYWFRFGGGATLVDINVSIPPTPSENHAVYKYEKSD